MSFLDKIASAVMPAASDEDRAQARHNAEALTHGDDWLTHVLQHHRRIEGAFAEAMHADGADARLKGLRNLATVLTGHANAEESVLYPAVVEHSGKGHAAMAFEEQAMAKVQMAKLEEIDPMSEQWSEKLEHLRSAVAQHIYQEESEWFPAVMQNAPAGEQHRLTARFLEEFNRYVGPQGARKAMPSAAHL